MANENIFDFEAFKKKLEEVKAQQEKAKESSKDNQEEMRKLMELYGSLFMPSPEDMNKAATQIASALEKMASTLRDTYKASDDTPEGEDK